MTRADEYGHLTGPVRARTIFQARRSTQATALLPGNGAGAAPTPQTGHQVALLVDQHSVYLAMPIPPETGSHLQIVCRTSLPGLGLLRLTGHTDDLLLPHETAALGLRTRIGNALTFALDTVDVLLPATRSSPASPLQVAPEEFIRAQHDPWVLTGPRVLPEVERRHQRRLRQLVAAARPVEAPGTVLVRRLRRDAMDVTLVTDDGVTDLALRYPRPVAGVAQLETWLAPAGG